MMAIVIPFAFAVFGALVYALAGNAKSQQLGLYLFAAGVFALAFAFPGHVLRWP